MKYKIVVCLGLILTLTGVIPAYPVSASSQPHHVYMGAFVGGDSRNPVGGGWDNDGTYDGSGSSYSVDRDMVTWQGKNFSFEQTYMAPDYDSPYLDIITYQELELIWYYGRVPMVNLTYGSWVGCQKTMVQLAAELGNSNSDSYKQLSKWAGGLKTWLELGKSVGKNNRFLILAFLQEGNHSYCATEANQASWDYVDPAAYKTAYTRGRQIIEGVLGPEPAARVQWMFAPVIVSNYWMPDFEAYYPGDNVVDWLGLSTYNMGGFSMPDWTFPWQTFEDAARPYLDRLTRMAPRKPLALAQFGSVSFAGDKNAWIRQFLDESLTYPRLYLLFYFNHVKPYEPAELPPGFDWPVFWNDPYDARPYGYNVNLPTMRYQGWLDYVRNSPYLSFSPIAMPPAGAFAAANWDILGTIAQVSNSHPDLVPELRDRTGDFDGDGVSNWEELASGLDPLVADKQPTETDCQDGIDNDANGRTDEDDTAACGDILLAEGISTVDNIIRQGEYRYFEFAVPGGSSRADITISNITGNVDLYVKRGGRPSTSSYDFKSTKAGTAGESITINSPVAGVWHVLVHGIQTGGYQIQVGNLFAVTPKLAGINNVAVCDIDHNGQDDILLSITNTGVQTFANNGTWMNLLTDGTFPSVMTCGDLEGDGHPKAIGIWKGSNSIKEFSVSSWSWLEINNPGSVPDALLVKDIDNDGKDELVGLFKSSNAIKLRRGSSGNWENVSLGGLSVPDQILIARVNGDPMPELLGVWKSPSQSSGHIRTYRFNTAVWSPDIALPAGLTTVPDIVSVSDIDNDGVSDIIGIWNKSPYAARVRIGFNGQWKELLPTTTSPDSKPARIEVADVDGDRKDDIFMVWDAWEQSWMYVQFWKGAKLIYEGTAPAFVASGNLDGDAAGREEVVMIWSDHIRVWLNNAGFVDVDVTAPAYAADFTATPVSGTGPLSVSFTDLSDNSPTSWLWDFGDGTTSAERNPRHNYTSNGTFSVTLTATGSGVSRSVTKNNYISVAACPMDPFRIGGEIQSFPDIQSAYGATGNGQALEMQALDFTDNLNINANKSVTLRGGFGCDFSPTSEHTEIEGSLIITVGTVIIHNITLE